MTVYFGKVHQFPDHKTLRAYLDNRAVSNSLPVLARRLKDPAVSNDDTFQYRNMDDGSAVLVTDTDYPDLTPIRRAAKGVVAHKSWLDAYNDRMEEAYKEAVEKAKKENRLNVIDF